MKPSRLRLAKQLHVGEIHREDNLIAGKNLGGQKPNE